MKNWILLFKLLFASAVIWLIADKFSIEQFSFLLNEPLLLVIPFFCWALNQLLTCTRAYLLLKKVGYVIYFINMARAHFSALFFGSVLPGVVGADVVKAGYLISYNKNFPKTKIASVLVFDRLFGIGTIITWGAFFSLVYFLFGNEQLTTVAVVPMIFLLIGFLVLLLFRLTVRLISVEKIPSIFRTTWDSFASISEFHKLKYSVPVIAASLLAVLILLLGLAIVGAVLHIQIDGQGHFLIQLFLLSLSLFVSAIPLTPLGIGVGQLTLSTVYPLYGLDPSVGVTVATIQQVNLLLVSIILGGPTVFTSPKISDQVKY